MSEEKRQNCAIDKMSDHDLLIRVAQQLEDFEKGFANFRVGFDNHLKHHGAMMIGALILAVSCAGTLAFFLLTQ